MKIKNANSDPMPRGAGDNNRGFHEPKQTKDKIYQNPNEININPQNDGRYPGKERFPDVPFNIDNPQSHY